MSGMTLDGYNPEMIARVMIVPGKAERKMIITGVRFSATAGQTTPHDKVFAETREIQGAWIEVGNHQPGDYIELTIHTNEGVEVGKFAETSYIPPSGKVDQIVSEGTVSLPAGFKLRVTYYATSAGDVRDAYLWYRMRK